MKPTVIKLPGIIPDSRAVLLALLLLAGGIPGPAVHAQEVDSPSQDTTVQADDSGGRFLVLPIFITEPAIGEGLGASLIYFHGSDDEDRPKLTTGREISRTSEKPKPPPTATGIFGFYTNSDTAAAGIGHSDSFADDRWRLVTAAAEARVNSQVYLADEAFDFRLEGSLLYTQLKRRLGDSDIFAGLTLSYLDAETKFLTGVPEIDDLDLLQSGFVDAGLALNLFYDTRDNTILPSRGYLVELSGWIHNDGGGSDFDYEETRFKGLYFTDFAKAWVVGLRLDIRSASGSVPFYAAPYVSLRGIPALRYQGKAAAAAEIELRRQLADRWVVSVFTGRGKVDSGFKFGETEDDIESFGTGIRYLALTEQDAWVGLDLARGPEDTAWYIQMGSSW